MNTGERLWTDTRRGMEAWMLDAPSPEFRAAVEHAWFGTGGLRYRRLGVAEQLSRLPAARFLELRREGKLAGTCALARSDVFAGDRVLPGWYRGLLTVPAGEQRQGHGRLLARLARDWVAHRGPDEGALSWGCVEAGNAPSLRLLERLGARNWGQLEASTLYRQWPRRRLQLERLEPGDEDAVHAAVLDSAVDCVLRAAPRRSGDYYAVTRGSRILAGARVSPTRVDMERIGGPWDWLYERVLRHAPPARRRFDPRNFYYLRLSDLVVRPGEAGLWKDFLPTLLADAGAHMAMVVLDPDSRAQRLLADAGLFGRLSRIARQEIRVMGYDWTEASGAAVEPGRPIGLGPLDL